MQQSVARGFQAAGENNGAAGMAFMGMGINGTANTIGAFNQPAQPIQQPTAQQASSTAEDPYEKLTKLKQLVDANVITQEEFDEAKKKLLGL